MAKSDRQMLTADQIARLQRSYLSATFTGSEPKIAEKYLESDGRRKNRIINEAVNAGILIPTNEKSDYGAVFRISAEVIASVVPVDFTLFDLWADLRNKYPHHEAYERPWIGVEGLSVEIQCALLKRDNIDWFVVSRVPYEYHGSFADAPETILTDGRPSETHNKYWSGPFGTFDEAIQKRKPILVATIAVSSKELRQKVADFYAERKIQWAFANNLLWGLVDVALVPKDVVYDADGKPTVNAQLDEGQSLIFASNPNPPSDRKGVSWEVNLAKSVERLKSRIAKAEGQLEKLRVIEARVHSFGGWPAFMDAMEQRLRGEILNEPGATPTT